jgi:hypothetical protein
MKHNPWLRAGFGMWSLGIEATSVIALRTLMIAGGGKAAEAEASRMVSEKIEAGLALQTMALTGGLGMAGPAATSKATALYLRKVRANRRRLTQK